MASFSSCDGHSVSCNRVIMIWVLGNRLTITMVTEFWSYMITIYDPHCWLPTRTVNGEVSRRLQMVIMLQLHEIHLTTAAGNGFVSWCGHANVLLWPHHLMTVLLAPITIANEGLLSEKEGMYLIVMWSTSQFNCDKCEQLIDFNFLSIARAFLLILPPC